MVPADLYHWLPNKLLNLTGLKPVGIALLIFLISWFLSGWVARLIARLISRTLYWSPTTGGTKIIKALEKPFRIFLVLAGLYVALRFLPLSLAVESTLIKAFRSAIIVFVAWVLYDLAATSSQFSEGIKDKLGVDNIILSFFSKLTRLLIFLLAVVIVIQEWGYNVNGLIAGLGLGGLALALATKDALANVVAGMVIIMEKPFLTGDWISTPGAEGTVEDISFRSTRIRATNQALITIPNSTLAGQPITNHARMGKRRLEFTLTVPMTIKQPYLEAFIEAVRSSLREHEEIEPDTSLVVLNTIGKDSLELLIRCFIINTRWEDYMRVREKINLRIWEIAGEELSSKYLY